MDGKAASPCRHPERKELQLEIGRRGEGRSRDSFAAAMSTAISPIWMVILQSEVVLSIGDYCAMPLRGERWYGSIIILHPR
jgi:hypothetical protein